MTTTPSPSQLEADPASSEALSDESLGAPSGGAVTGDEHSVEHAAGHAVAELPPASGGHPDPRLTGEEPVTGPRPLTLLVYSDDMDTRADVRLAIGRRVAADLPPVEWTECATHAAVIEAVDRGGIDVLILDGEAAPSGGMGLCKQLKDEIYRCPPILVLTGRPQDAWLATWSRADAAVPHPLDPSAVAEAVATLARQRRGATRS